MHLYLCLQDDVAYNFNPLCVDDGDDDINDKLPSQDSCARTTVYAPKRARYFIVYFFKEYCMETMQVTPVREL